MAKKYISYNEELARKLQKKFGLKETTIRVWKHRQGIPERYADPNYQPRTVASKSQLKNCRHFLALSFINRSQFEGIPAHTLNDFMNSDKHNTLALLQAEQLLNHRKFIKKELKKIIHKQDGDALAAILQLPFIRPTILLASHYASLRHRFDKLKNEDWETIKPLLQAALDQL
ncbi:hypothetical protein [Saprospira grandis]|uniref:Uncharacterized protein n=1 Tax=Saprospira grandis (strain Lewin) TaxID=984262 RepID=H6L9L0_SAPGL|nr:hypothetical protein [Saprospira grandis]AFC23188.1 hypothetical protein SGRA_0449 [Saprospira grandis str. Lewin]